MVGDAPELRDGFPIKSHIPLFYSSREPKMDGRFA